MSLLLEVNVRGDWRTIAEFDADRLPEVEDAAASLARAAGGLRLRTTHPDGSTQYLNDRGSFRGLHEVGDIDCPVTSGLDRTTSGAIGQP